VKLRRLEIEGFRAFGAGVQVDLDANAVILVGVNGSGKTSLFDAVMWSLSGRLPRVEDPGGSVISEFAASGEARVAVELELDGGESMSVVRSRTRGDQQARLQVELNGSVLRAGEAQVELYRTLWPAALSAPEGEVALMRALTRCVYLQQDLVREFVESDDDSERFQTVSELVGVGRVRELQVELDKARRAWSQATNKLDAEAEPERRRLAGLENQLERLSADSDPAPSLAPEWRAWWKGFAEMFDDVPAPPAADAPNAVGALDDALKRLAAEHRSDDRRLLEAEALTKELAEDREQEQAEPLEPLSARLEEAKTATEGAQAALESARKLEGERRELALRTEEQAAQLGALAELALKHLGERCPVCTQEYDREQTLAHLHSLINDSAVGPAGTSRSEGPNIEGLGKQLIERQRREQELEADLARWHTQEQSRALANRQRAERIAAIGIPSDLSADDALRKLIAATEQRHQSSASLREAGESLALALAKSSELTRSAELTREREALALAVEGSAATVAARRETGELAGRILERLRTSAEHLVQAQLSQIEPLVERVYARVDPHPAFRRVQLSSRFEHSRGRISTSVEDTLATVVVKRPGTVLSSSQLNALAVSIFLAFNLGVLKRPLDSVLLDDPLQSLDDVNLLGLVDLLRRTKQRRQLIVSTHDPRFAALLERKLRPGADTSTIIVELSGWRREGPRVEQRRLPAEAQPLRLVA
jgi:DNA repair exonuclease SbcCD ATPase subunit